MTRVRLRARARQDLREIGRYTAEVWGAVQRDAYLRAIDARLKSLAEHDRRASPRADIGADWISVRAGRHVIFALRRDWGVEVVRILH